METLIQSTTDGKILSPDLLKVSWGKDVIVFNNKQTREMNEEERINKNKESLDKAAEVLGPAFAEAGIKNEEDVLSLIREIRYGQT